MIFEDIGIIPEMVRWSGKTEMSHLFVAIIPIPDYYGENVYEQHVYIQRSNEFLDMGHVLAALKWLHERDSKHPEYYGNWQDCLNSLSEYEGFPQLFPGKVATSFNAIVKVANGKRSVSAGGWLKKIEPVVVE